MEKNLSQLALDQVRAYARRVSAHLDSVMEYIGVREAAERNAPKMLFPIPLEIEERAKDQHHLLQRTTKRVRKRKDILGEKQREMLLALYEAQPALVRDTLKHIQLTTEEAAMKDGEIVVLVAKRVHALRKAGLVSPDPRNTGSKNSFRWVLTDQGLKTALKLKEQEPELVTLKNFSSVSSQ